MPTLRVQNCDQSFPCGLTLGLTGLEAQTPKRSTREHNPTNYKHQSMACVPKINYVRLEIIYNGFIERF